MDITGGIHILNIMDVVELVPVVTKKLELPESDKLV